MTDQGSSKQPGRTGFVVWVVMVAVPLVTACVLATIAKGINGLVAAATIATALGTLALAWQTFALAKATRKSVEESSAELGELQRQRALLERQADTAVEQVTASQAAALAAEKARVDAIAPLLYLEVEISGIEVFESGQPMVILSPGWQRPASYLRNLRFDVALNLTLENVGRAPARLSFGETSWFLEGRQSGNLTGVDLKPGKVYRDRYIVRLFGDQAVQGEFVKMPFTYEGTMHAEMSDRIQWNGWVTPATVDEMDVVPHELPLNSGGAQVIRTYPNIERPEEMAEARKKLIEGTP